MQEKELGNAARRLAAEFLFFCGTLRAPVKIQRLYRQPSTLTKSYKAQQAAVGPSHVTVQVGRSTTGLLLCGKHIPLLTKRGLVRCQSRPRADTK